MAVGQSRKRGRRRRPEMIQKPRGVIHPRVQQVGPEHFGILSVDCAKARSKWMLADFYGNILVTPTQVEHHRPGLELAVLMAREAMAWHDLRDVLVAVERTGRYHHPIKRAFQAASFDVRIVHPFTTKRFRQPADPGTKTDDTDLAAIHRAAVNGFALGEAPLDTSWREFQLLVRQRRDLVRKISLLCCQIKEHLEAALPGYAACFAKFWQNPAAMHLAGALGSVEALRSASAQMLSERLRADGVRFQQRTVERVREWSAQAAAADQAAERHHRIAMALEADRAAKTQEILALEREIATLLASTEYVVLLSIPGINVVSAGELAGEAGPIANYANANCLKGRAGLYPARYQSDQVDIAGSLVHCANRRLRFAMLLIADNLLLCNRNFTLKAQEWKLAGKDPRHTRVKVAARFCRIAFHLLAGNQVFRHPSCQQPNGILAKLIAFHREHETPMDAVLADLHKAIERIPRTEYGREAEPLANELERLQSRRRRGVIPRLGDILPVVLARLGVGAVQSSESGEHDPR
jgi:transposase